MKELLDELAKRTMTLVSERAAQNDIDAIRMLSDTAGRIKQCQEQFAAIEQETMRIEAFLEGFSLNGGTIIPSPGPASSQGTKGKKLRIRIDWSRIGKQGGEEVISSHKSSSSMATFIQRLAAVLGEGILEKLSQFRISRGPIVSKTPERDFLNIATGQLYTHQKVFGTPYFVLTHSETSQKVADLQDVEKYLGLPFGMIEVSAVDKRANA